MKNGTTFTNKNIYAIHGAYSSPNIFNYIRHRLGKTYSWTFLNYQHQTSDIDNILNGVIDLSEQHHIIGHSMGGLFGLKLADKPWVKSITTIATPLGGLELNIIQRYLSRTSFLTELCDYGDFIKSVKNTKTDKPIQHLITTRGFSPFIYEPNDGVVTVRTQLAYKLGNLIQIEAGHLEVMMLDETVNHIKSFLK